MSANDQNTQSDQPRDTKTRCDWQVLFDGYPSILTYRKGDLTPRADGKIVPKYETLQGAPTPEDFERHFRGEISLGRSPLRKDGLVTFGAIDIDIYQAREKVLDEIKHDLRGAWGALFMSKSRALQFYMFCEPSPAADMVDALDYVRSKLRKAHRAHAKEIFPKQTDPNETDTPNAINLPMFGAERELVCIVTPKDIASVSDLVNAQAVGRAILEHVYLSADDVHKLAERNRARKQGGRPVRDVGPVGFKEPKDAEGRQHFLFLVGSSMRSRGADMEQIKEQLFEMDRHYAEINHPIWEGEGRLDPARIESALKSISKFEQGTPSDLHYSKVEEFNKEFAIVDLQGHIEVLDCNSRELKTWSWGDFQKKTMNRRVRVGKSTVPIAALWITDIDRREYSGVVIEPVEYEGKGYNLWRGFEIEPIDGDPSVFLWYIEEVLCNGDKKAAEWIIQYLADAVQRPTEPSPPSALGMRGPQGHGKSLLLRLLQAIFGRGCREIASSDRLFAQFNRPIAGCPIIVAEESIFSGDVKLAAVCKTFISSPVWDYEEKFRAIVTMKNVHRLIAITNSDHAVHLDNDDRRWTIIEVPERWDASTEVGKQAAWDYLDPMYQFLRGDGPAITLHYLLNVEVDRQLITHGLTNDAKARDKIMSDPVLQFLHEAAETLVLPHDRDGKGVASVQSVVEDVRRRSPAARYLTPEAISHQICRVVKHAERVRAARYVERVQMNQDG